MRGFHLTLSVLLRLPWRDTQCGFKMCTRKTARLLYPSIHLRGWLFDVELLLLAQLNNVEVREVLVRWHEVPGSKVRLVRDALKMLRDCCILRFMYATGVWHTGQSRLELRRDSTSQLQGAASATSSATGKPVPPSRTAASRKPA